MSKNAIFHSKNNSKLVNIFQKSKKNCHGLLNPSFPLSDTKYLNGPYIRQNFSHLNFATATSCIIKKHIGIEFLYREDLIPNFVPKSKLTTVKGWKEGKLKWKFIRHLKFTNKLSRFLIVTANKVGIRVE